MQIRPTFDGFWYTLHTIFYVFCCCLLAIWTEWGWVNLGEPLTIPEQSAETTFAQHVRTALFAAPEFRATVGPGTLQSHLQSSPVESKCERGFVLVALQQKVRAHSSRAFKISLSAMSMHHGKVYERHTRMAQSTHLHRKSPCSCSRRLHLRPIQQKRVGYTNICVTTSKCLNST